MSAPAPLPTRSSSPRTAASRTRLERLRAPLALTLGVLLAFEAAGGLVIFIARLAAGTLPGERVHVVAGVALTLSYAVYQIQHWSRVAPFRARLDYALGLTAAGAMVLVNATGLWLGWLWWQARAPGAAAAEYPAWLSALHNIASMLVLTFVASHIAAALTRDRVVRGKPEL